MDNLTYYLRIVQVIINYKKEHGESKFLNDKECLFSNIKENWGVTDSELERALDDANFYLKLNGRY